MTTIMHDRMVLDLAQHAKSATLEIKALFGPGQLRKVPVGTSPIQGLPLPVPSPTTPIPVTSTGVLSLNLNFTSTGEHDIKLNTTNYAPRHGLSMGRVKASLRVKVDGDRHRPVGISFVEFTDAKRQTVLNPTPPEFPLDEVLLNDDSVSFVVDFSNSHKTRYFEAYVIVQDRETGGLGVIDPPIDHDQ